MNQDDRTRAAVPPGDEKAAGTPGSGTDSEARGDEFILTGDLSGRPDEDLSGDGGGNEGDGKADMTVDVGETVNRLEQLDRLLGELNFRELIMQFGKVQGELELIRYELDTVKKESVRVREKLMETECLNFSVETGTVETVRKFRERVSALVNGLRKLVSQQEILNNYVKNSRGWLLERSADALAALQRVRRVQKSRMEMAASLNQMLESDAPNEQLASAALEFAVLMRELDRDEGLEKLDEVISEISGFHEKVEQAESLVLNDSPPLDELNDSLGLVEIFPDVADGLLSFLTMVTRTLDTIEKGWNGEKLNHPPVQGETESAESDE
ncbi:MAG: hypothetical protein GXO69_07635 [Acidobacteria bacterium]|nr:hypothetical protein [Acidobacteriota bacterium]